MAGSRQNVIFGQGLDITNDYPNISNQLGTDGFVYIGNSAGRPIAALPTSSDGSITITGGNGSLDLTVAASNDAVLTLTGDAGGAVSPTSGDIDVQGVTVANAANAKPLFVQGTPGSSLLEVDIQVGAAITGAPVDSNDAGLVSFDDTQFTVDANGFVQLSGTGAAQTITGDTGGALSPTAGNWNIVGGTNVSTSGSGSTLTINASGAASGTWVVETGATKNLVAFEGTFGNSGLDQTFTLPATAAVGDIIEVVQMGAGAVTIDYGTGQLIHFGTSSSTTTTGSITSTNQWDAVKMVCNVANSEFTVVSSIGTWTIV